MATTVNGPTRNWGHSYYIYTTSSTNTTYTITISEAGVITTGYIDGDYGLHKPGSSEIVAQGTIHNLKGKRILVTSKAFSFTRTHTAQTKEVFFLVSARLVGRTSYGSGAKKTITIPARPSYTVTYNANSGSSAPANQTKWHDETLQISPTKPTKNGYIFRGWATSQADANVGTVAYAAGANYTGNAALTLYAVWELAYTLPVINNLTVERCNDDGSDNDEGTYAKVSFDWSVFESNEPRYYGGSGTPFSGNTASIVITVGTLSKTISAPSSASITEVIDASVTDPFIVDNEYPVVITIEDTQTVISNNTRTVTSRLLTPTFILDANADATAVGILKSAPDDGQGVYLGGDVHAEEKVGYFGDLYLNNQTAHVGQVFNWQGNLKANLTANADAYVEGNGSITLRGGHVYLVLAYVAMTNSTNGTVDRRAQIFNKTANSAVLTGDKFVASQSWGTVETQTIYEANEDVTLTVRGAASRPTTTIPTAWIRAVCIA